MAKTKKLTSLSALISKSWDFYKLNFKMIFIILLVGSSIGLLDTILMAVLPQTNPIIFYIVNPLLSIGNMVMAIWGLIAVISYINKPGQNFENIFSDSWNKFWSMLWIMFLFCLLLFFAFLLLFIPAIIVYFYFVFIPFILVIEGIKGIEAFKKSKDLVKGYWWAIFGRVLAIFLIYFVIITIISLIYRIFNPALFLNLMVNVITVPIMIYLVIVNIIGLIFGGFTDCFYFFIYKELKEIKSSEQKEIKPAEIKSEPAKSAVK